MPDDIEETKVENKEETHVHEALEAKPGIFWYVFQVGIVLHELAHYLGCLLVGAKVVKIVLLDKHGGLVAHNKVPPFESWIIALMPFLIGNLIAFFLFTDAIRAFNASNLIYFAIALWIGISTSLYAEPSDHDLKQAWQLANQIWSKSKAVEKVFIVALLPIVYLTLFVMELKKRVFPRPTGSLVWTVLSFLVAKAYVTGL